jgi:hypothetical protein
MLDARVDRGDRWLREQQHRHVESCLPQLDGLLDECDREPARTTVERGSGCEDRAVAVAVRLDDRAHLRAGDGRDARDVAGERGGVDLGTRRTEPHAHRRPLTAAEEVTAPTAGATAEPSSVASGTRPDGPTSGASPRAAS